MQIYLIILYALKNTIFTYITFMLKRYNMKNTDILWNFWMTQYVTFESIMQTVWTNSQKLIKIIVK